MRIGLLFLFGIGCIQFGLCLGQVCGGGLMRWFAFESLLIFGLGILEFALIVITTTWLQKIKYTHCAFANIGISKGWIQIQCTIIIGQCLFIIILFGILNTTKHAKRFKKICNILFNTKLSILNFSNR